MKKILIAALLGLGLSAPAHATGGLICATAGNRALTMALVISHTAIPAAVSARLIDRGSEVPVALAQSWLDEQEVRVDLVDRNALRHEARLSARKRGDRYDGAIWRNGKRHWVRCREG